VPSKTILDATLVVRLDLGDARIANDEFAARPDGKAQLANALLLYDSVAIPTYDLGIVPTLVRWLGPGAYLEALKGNAFRFIRRRGLLGYVGNGNGLSTLLIDETPRKSFEWWQEAVFGVTHAAMERQISNRLSDLSRVLRSHLLVESMKAVLEPGYDNEFFLKHIVQESYEDVEKNPRMIKLFQREFPGRVDLTRLPSVRPQDARILSCRGITDSVDLLLRVADVNMELFLAAAVGYADLYTVGHADELLRMKLARRRVAPATLQGFVSLLELNDLPDIGSAVTNQELTLEQIVDIRQHKDAVEFRRWLQTVPIVEPQALVKAYIKALSSKARPEGWVRRTVRLAITTAVGAINMPAGLAASVADTFFLEKWTSGYSPRLFLDRVADLDLPKQS